MACAGECLEPEIERKLYRNWRLLKTEINVDKMTNRLVEKRIFSENIKRDIGSAQPNTKIMRAEKFLHSIIKVGSSAYEAFCDELREDSNIYTELLDVLDIPETPRPDECSQLQRERPLSSSTYRNHTNNCRMQDASLEKSENSENEHQLNFSLLNDITQNDRYNSTCIIAQETTSQMAMAAAASIIPSYDNENAVEIDVKRLEVELVKIAPTIAELFEKISVSVSTEIPDQKEEYNQIRNENENLRKENRLLVEKLNTFQQRIIHLQLENKRLRDSGEGTKVAKLDLDKRAFELESLRQKFEKQKQDLEQKEYDLDTQLRKIKDIEEASERQKQRLMELQVQHEEGMAQRYAQQQQIFELRAEKEKHQEKIEILEEIQREDEERLNFLEERLNSIEQYGLPRFQPQTTQKSSTRSKRNTRVVSPPGSIPWMSGALNRSHHANVKYTPPPVMKGELKDAKGKGWSF